MAEPERCRERVMLEVGGATDCDLPLPCPVHGPENAGSPAPERCTCSPLSGPPDNECPEHGITGPPPARERPPGVVPSAEARPPADDEPGYHFRAFNVTMLRGYLCSITSMSLDDAEELARDLFRWGVRVHTGDVPMDFEPSGEATIDRDPDGNVHTEACASTECPCWEDGHEANVDAAVERTIAERADRDALALIIGEAWPSTFEKADAVLALLAGEETTDEPEQCGQPYWRYFGHGLCSRPIGHDGWCGPQPSDVDAPRRKETTDGTT